MSEEIELILYKIEQNYKCDKEQYFVLYKPDAKQLLDYVTNLNERFNSLLEAHKIADELNDMLHDENEQLKEQKKKVVEYIKEHKDKYYHDWGEDDGSYDTYLDDTEINKIVNMLGDE